MCSAVCSSLHTHTAAFLPRLVCECVCCLRKCKNWRIIMLNINYNFKVIPARASCAKARLPACLPACQLNWSMWDDDKGKSNFINMSLEKLDHIKKAKKKSIKINNNKILRFVTVLLVCVRHVKYHRKNVNKQIHIHLKVVAVVVVVAYTCPHPLTYNMPSTLPGCVCPCHHHH